MRPSQTLPLAAAFLLLVSMLLVAPSGTATHAGVYEGSLPSSASNHVYQNLTIKKVSGNASASTNSGGISNATVKTWMRVDSSAGLTIRKTNVTTSLTLHNVSRSEYSNSSVGGTAYVNASGNLHFLKVTFKGEVHVSASNGVNFNQSTFEKCVRIDSASHNINFTSPAPPLCGTTTTSSSPTTRTTAPSPTVVSDCYSSGQFVPCPSPTSTSPKPTSNPYDSYVYELQGQRTSNVYVKGADRVTIRNSVILGPVYIGASANVFLENVEIAGSLTVEQGVALSVSHVRVGGDLRFSSVTDFKVAGDSIGGGLYCLKCLRGTFQDLRVGGLVDVRESLSVARVNVLSQAAVEYQPPPPAPESGELKLNVTDEGLAFTHETDIGGKDSGVTVDFNPVEARARLELSPPSGDQPGLSLESRFEKIVEFEDRNGDGAYDLSDLVLREYLVDDLKASVTQERLEGEDGWRGRIDYALPSGGTFSLIFTARDADPDNTKIDVAFSEYPYDSPTSQLALQVRLASASDWDIVPGDVEDRLVFHGQGVDGFFGWLHSVRADGEDTTVTARVLEEHRSQAGEREVVLYLAYPHAKEIFHDPSLGLFEAAGLTVPELGNLLIYGTTFVAVLAVLWALGHSSRRKP